jgi:hypothetical protein
VGLKQALSTFNAVQPAQTTEAALKPVRRAHRLGNCFKRSLAVLAASLLG